MHTMHYVELRRPGALRLLVNPILVAAIEEIDRSDRCQVSIGGSSYRVMHTVNELAALLGWDALPDRTTVAPAAPPVAGPPAGGVPASPCGDDDEFLKLGSL